MNERQEMREYIEKKVKTIKGNAKLNSQRRAKKLKELNQSIDKEIAKS
ncbi:hypothetical protein [Aliikangiella sp. IMCC44359]